MQFVLGLNEHLLAVNEIACARLGYSREWLVGRHFSTISDGNVLYDNKRNPIRVKMRRTQLPQPQRSYSDTWIEAVDSLMLSFA